MVQIIEKITKNSRRPFMINAPGALEIIPAVWNSFFFFVIVLLVIMIKEIKSS